MIDIIKLKTHEDDSIIDIQESNETDEESPSDNKNIINLVRLPSTVVYENETQKGEAASKGAKDQEKARKGKNGESSNSNSPGGSNEPGAGVKVTNIINLNITHNYFISGKF